MRSPLVLSLLTPLFLLAPTHTHAQSSAPASTQPVQVRRNLQFDLNVPPAQAAPLFGPEGERCWAGGNWDPHFVYPQPAHDQQDAVFTIAHGQSNMTWVNTAFNLPEGHIQYVAIMPSAMVMTIDLRLTATPTGTHIDATFIHTALDPSLNARVTEMADRHASNGSQWAHDIAACLQTH